MDTGEARGRLVVISGPSGAGKTSVCRELKKDPRVAFSVSATTRAPRQGEVDGVDYFFLDDATFVEREARGEFLESAVYNGNRYGTPKAPVDEAIEAGKIFLLEIEVQGTRKLRDNAVDGLFVFIVPPSLEVLRQRLESRGQNAKDDIESRMRIASEELEAKTLYDEIVVNETLPDTIDRVRTLLGLGS